MPAGAHRQTPNIGEIEKSWFSVLSPVNRDLGELKKELLSLGKKVSKGRA